MSETPQVFIGNDGATSTTRPQPLASGVSRINVGAASICNGIQVSWDNVRGSKSMQVIRNDGTLVYSGKFIRNYPDTIFTSTPPTCGFQYSYTVLVFQNTNRTALLAQGSNAGSPVTACLCSVISTGFSIESRKGSFEVLFPRGTVIEHYTHRKGSIQVGHWKHVNTLYAPAGGAILDTAISLIQSASGNFEAVAVVTPLEDRGQNYLVSYVFDPESGWQEPSILTTGGHSITGATGTPALIQTQQGFFELFVPQGNSIGRYMHEQGSIKDGLWTPLAPFGTPDLLTYTAISLVQDASGQLELIARAAPVQAPQRGESTDYLVSFVSSSVDPQTPFQHVGPLLADGQPIIGVTGTPSFTQNARGIFELIVPLGALMDQYILETGSIGDNLWKHVSTLEPLKNDHGIQFTATSLIQSTSGKLELVARVMPPQGEGADFLVSYEFTGWSRPRPFIVDRTSSNEDNDKDKQDTD